MESRPQADPFPVPVQALQSQGFLPIHAIRTGRHQTIPFQAPSLVTNNGINGRGTSAPARFSTRDHGLRTSQCMGMDKSPSVVVAPAVPIILAA